MQLFVVKKMLEGCKRLGKRQDLRAPVTMKILKSICDRLPFVCYNEYEALMFRTVYLIAYYGLMRIGEIVFTSVFQSDRPLQVTDISFRGKTVVQITIRVAKNNQKGQPIYLRIPCMPGNTLCPVCCLQNYLTVRQQQPGQLFIHSNGKPLTRSQFTAVLAKSVQGTIYRSRHIRSHSFRIGRASDLASLGVDVEMIKVMGRWKSAAYKTYIRL